LYLLSLTLKPGAQHPNPTSSPAAPSAIGC
jgi:hypothetical protein